MAGRLSPPAPLRAAAGELRSYGEDFVPLSWPVFRFSFGHKRKNMQIPSSKPPRLGFIVSQLLPSFLCGLSSTKVGRVSSSSSPQARLPGRPCGSTAPARSTAGSSRSRLGIASRPSTHRCGTDHRRHRWTRIDHRRGDADCSSGADSGLQDC